MCSILIVSVTLQVLGEIIIPIPLYQCANGGLLLPILQLFMCYYVACSPVQSPTLFYLINTRHQDVWGKQWINHVWITLKIYFRSDNPIAGKFQIVFYRIPGFYWVILGSCQGLGDRFWCNIQCSVLTTSGRQLQFLFEFICVFICICFIQWGST